ncbi:MAG: LLM class flavin-dependent oxidoreductase [Actinomycetota bacterium]|nr:LLM class flavin-dependent oxidoreductase [Actinomycetota bacterium]
MGLGFGLLSGQRVADDARSWEDVYRELIELTVHLERRGYSSAWTTEHHFVDDGYMPSLLVTSAAMAAVTTKIEIGTGVLLAPLHHPIRLAEDAATVQAISDGRLLLGLGLGWSETEFVSFGSDISKRGKAMEEILQFLPKAWTGEPFTWDGEIYSYPELAVRPAPRKHIPVIVGGSVDAAVRRAARHADGFFSNASPERFIAQVAVADEEMERIGRDPSTFRWIYYAVMYPGHRDEILESVWHQTWKYSDMEDSATRGGPIARTGHLTDESEASMRKRIVGGSPEEIIHTIGTLRDRVGVPVEWVARSHFADLHYGPQIEIVDRLAEDVMPHLPTT